MTNYDKARTRFLSMMAEAYEAGAEAEAVDPHGSDEERVARAAHLLALAERYREMAQARVRRCESASGAQGEAG